MLHVDAKAALVAVERGEEADRWTGQTPGVVAPWARLDLDDVGAEVRQN
jgi:hypothetical protein